MNNSSFNRKFGAVLVFWSLAVWPLTARAEAPAINTEAEISTSLPVFLAKRQLIADLKKAIHQYEKFEGEVWPTVTPGKKIVKGERGPRVVQLKERLKLEGDYEVSTNTITMGENADLFDDDLEAAIKNFQLRHGLNADGVAGVATVKMMNEPAHKLIHKLRVNQQRIADEMPDDFGGKFIFVNIPDFRLSLVENGELKMGMRVIAGKTKTRTPLFSDEMEYVVLSPKWNVPTSITAKEILPKVQADPTYLSRNGYRVVPTKKLAEGETFDPAQIDWSQVDAGNLNFRLVKGSGDGNDLGLYKFIFPNQHSVYLHDTNSRGKFVHDMRALSHGCVRISRPLDLAEYLLKDLGWTRETIESTARQGREKFVQLEQRLPVHIQYFTAWVDAKGRVNFRDDVYGLDKKVVLREESAEDDTTTSETATPQQQN